MVRADDDRAPSVGARLTEALVWRILYLLIQSGASLLLLVLFAQLLPAQAFAVTAVALAVVVIAQALGDLGLAQAVLTGLPSASANEALPQIRGAVTAFGGAAALAAILDVVAALVVPSEARTAVLVCAPAAAAIVAVSGADALLRARGELRRSAWLILLVRAGGFASIPVAAETDEADLVCLTFSIGTVVGATPAVLALWGSTLPGRRDWRLARVALPLGLAQLFVVAGGRLNTLVLGSVASLQAAAAFEAAWRVYQLSLYSIGALASGAAPLLGGASRPGFEPELYSLLRRLALAAATLGTVAGVVLLLGGEFLGELLFPAIGDEVGDVLRTFAFVCPLTFLGSLASTALAVLAMGRRLILGAHAVGASVGLTAVLLLAPSRGAEGGAIGCALGLAVTYLPLSAALVRWQLRLHAAADDSR